MNRRELMLMLGGALNAVSRPLRAQQLMPVIGYLSPGSPESDAFRLTGVRQGLNETGHVEGQSVAIEYRWAEGQHDRLPELAVDLVRRQVAVIVAAGVPPAFAAKAATTTIPIVFNSGIDPVQSGLVASLNRPGGNITGVALLAAELAAKRLELLHELVPTASVVAVLGNPANPGAEAEARSMQDAARSLGLQAHVLRASTPSEIDVAFQALIELRVGALVVGGDALFTNQRTQVVALTARHAVPAINQWRDFAVAGGLMSYGPGDIADIYRQVGVYTGKILKGAKPADLPVQQVVKVELVINLTTAKALGLTVPLTLLGRADEVIE